MNLPAIHPDDTARARKSDPLTSHEAAGSNDLAASQAEVRTILNDLGAASDEQILAENQRRLDRGVAFTKLTPSRGRSARLEIGAEPYEVEGRIQRALTSTGSRAQMWTLNLTDLTALSDEELKIVLFDRLDALRSAGTHRGAWDRADARVRAARDEQDRRLNILLNAWKATKTEGAK